MPHLDTTFNASRALFDAAQQQADRFNGIARPWQPSTGVLQRRVQVAAREALALIRVLGVALVCALGLLVAAGAGLTAVSARSAVKPQPDALQAQEKSLQPVGCTQVFRSVPTQAAAASIPSAAAVNGVATARGEIRIDLADVPLLQAAQQLAVATQTELVGATALRDSPRRVWLKWQGHSRLEAWQRLLVDDANYAARCDARRCRLWLLDGSASQQLALSVARTYTDTHNVTHALAHAPITAGTANVADAVPAVPLSAPPHPAVRQPDPVGLFPPDG